MVWDITEYQDRLQVNKSIESSDSKNVPANMVMKRQTLFILIIFNFYTQAIFDTEPKLDHAPIVQCTVLSSIEGGHANSITDLTWIPEHIEVKL